MIVFVHCPLQMLSIYCLDSESSCGFVFIYVFANRYTVYILYLCNFEHFLPFPIQASVQPPTLEDAQAKLCCRTCVSPMKGHKKDSKVSTELKVEFNTYYIVYNNSI